MTTFDFSIHKAPSGRNWHKQFSNNACPTAVVGNLGPYGIHGWNGTSVFSQWLQNEGLKKYQPDWCLHVAKGSRKQILAFADIALEMKLSGATEHAALIRAIESSNEVRFVIQVTEF